MPKDGETLAVRVVHETKPEVSWRGVLFVQRDLPQVKRYNGAQYAECTNGCVGPEGRAGYRPWTVRVIPASGRFRRERYPVCEKCGLMHELNERWL